MPIELSILRPRQPLSTVEMAHRRFEVPFPLLELAQIDCGSEGLRIRGCGRLQLRSSLIEPPEPEQGMT